MAEERVDAMLALRRAEERRLAGSEVCARDWTPAKKGGGRFQKKHLNTQKSAYGYISTERKCEHLHNAL